MEIMSRNKALTSGLTRYFTGQPCINGHISERYVGSGACKECIVISNDAFKIPRPTGDLQKWAERVMLLASLGNQRRVRKEQQLERRGLKQLMKTHRRRGWK